MRCPKCSADVESGAKFCGKCGARLPPEDRPQAGRVTLGDVGMLKGDIDASTSVSHVDQSQTNITEKKTIKKTQIGVQENIQGDKVGGSKVEGDLVQGGKFGGDQIAGTQIRASKVTIHKAVPKSILAALLISVVLGMIVAVVISWRLLSGGSGPSQDINVTVEVPNVSREVEAALKLAYTTELAGEAPAAATEILLQPEGRPSHPWRPLKDGEAISSTDNYRILLRPERPAYFYVFQVDSTGKLDWLFPRNGSPYSYGTNPVVPGVWTQIPDGEQALHVDENLGVEHIYVVATGSRWDALEAALERARKGGAGRKNISASFGLRTRGVGGARPITAALPAEFSASPDHAIQLVTGKAGALVVERWFRHVAPAKPAGEPLGAAVGPKRGRGGWVGALFPGACGAVGLGTVVLGI